VRWRTRVTGEQAMVQILRGQEVLDDIALVRERGAWRLDLSARIEQGASTRRATD